MIGTIFQILIRLYIYFIFILYNVYDSSCKQWNRHLLESCWLIILLVNMNFLCYWLLYNSAKYSDANLSKFSVDDLQQVSVFGTKI